MQNQLVHRMILENTPELSTSERYLSGGGIGRQYHKAVLEKTRIPDKLGQFIDNLEDNLKSGKGLLILGPVGTGKTSCLAIIAKAILALNRHEFNLQSDFVFTSLEDLVNAICTKDYDFTKDCNGTLALMLDDFGREYFPEFAFSTFENMIEFRYANKQSTFITSNLTAESLRENRRFQRIVDRWRECNEVIQISGESMRKSQQ